MAENRTKTKEKREVHPNSLANLSKTGGPGRKAIPKEVRELFEAALPDIARKLVDTALNSQNEDLAYKAQVTVVERILGKPRQEIDMDVQGQMQIMITGEVKNWGV